MADSIYKAKENGALFIQPDGPNGDVHYLGCFDLEDIEEPKGGISLIQCFTEDGEVKTLGFTEELPSPITTTLGTYIGPKADAIEGLNHPFAIYAQLRDRGKASTLGTYRRGFGLHVAKITDVTRSSIVRREEDAAPGHTFAIAALPPVRPYYALKGYRVSLGEAAGLSAITFKDADCEEGVFATKALSGSPSDIASVFYTVDSGENWTEAAAQPFAAGEDISDIVIVEVGAGTDRWIAANGTSGAGNANISYSDDDGATWNDVDVGSVTGQYITALFALGKGAIWAVTDDGYIYKSTDGGETWTAQESGVIHTGAYNDIVFADTLVGMAVGAGDIVAITVDGGKSWSAATATGGGNALTALAYSGAFWFVGDGGGGLYYSDDHGDSWTQRTGFEGSGSGSVDTIEFLDEFRGVIAHNNGGSGNLLATFTGGAEWFGLSEPANSGINAIHICDGDLAWAVGDAHSGSGLLLKVQPK